MPSVATIDIASACIGWERRCPDVRRLARKTAQAALHDGIAPTALTSPARVEVGITLTDNAGQQQLNFKYRGEPAPTNVLAFPAWDPDAPVPYGAPLLLGDIVLAFETVEREAVDQGKTFVDHFRHLVVHGVLHLLGWEHQSEAAAAEMEALETSILAKLGVPDPYYRTRRSIEPEAACP
jgi:probable rRNA maturation factor